MDVVSVYVTAPDMDTARRLARMLLDQRLVACANMWPVASVYRWEGEVREDQEVALLLKTRRALLAQLESAIAASHPHQVPCIVAWSVAGGAPAYLGWVASETSRG